MNFVDFKNLDLEKIITPVGVEIYERLLREAQYDPEEIDFVVNGFKFGFSLEYTGDRKVRMSSPNLKLERGMEADLWEKIMKEVECKRFAGPFAEPPFEHFIQSPLALVPKGEEDTRLIFHLSYLRGGAKKSVNANTPKENAPPNTRICPMLFD